MLGLFTSVTLTHGIASSVTLNIEGEMVDESSVVEPGRIRPPSRRGKMLKVAKIVMVLEDGSIEQWEFPPEEPGLYREGGNRQTKPEKFWTTHTLWWKSDVKVEK
jgi:hypothetical protein